MRGLTTLGALLLFASSFLLHGQSSAAARTQTAAPQLPAFDVASIKPYSSSSNEMRIGMGDTDDGIRITGAPMHVIIREAFGVTNDRLLGEPGWVSTSRYDIHAKVAPEDAPKLKLLSEDQRRAMLVPVLEDRCALKFHHESRDLTVYTLVAAKGGPKLQPSKLANPGVQQEPPRKASAGISIGDKGLTMSGHGASIESIARFISFYLGSTVVDKTGLTGTYDYTLSFAPDESMRAGFLPPANGGVPPPEAQGPSIFSALQDQLGLKLEAKKEPVDVVVIDHIEQPSAN
jgi:uncharacterized protein (TIGR03435 family)